MCEHCQTYRLTVEGRDDVDCAERRHTFRATFTVDAATELRARRRALQFFWEAGYLVTRFLEIQLVKTGT